MQRSSQSGASENISLKDSWLTTDLDEDPRKTPSHDTSVSLENNNIMLTLSQSIPHVQENPSRKGASASEVIDFTASEGVRNTSNVNCF